MLQVSDQYRALADANARKIEVKVVIGSTVYTSESIIELKIYRSVGDGGLAIGNAISDYCQMTLATTNRVKSNVQVVPYVRFLGDTNSEWLQLGIFWVTDTSAGRGHLEITAHDKMYTLDKRCTYLGTTTGSVSPLSFPCTMQQLLQYTCDCRGLSCDFECEDFTVLTRPLANESASGDDRYYTHRQMLGYIAGVHGCNACFNNTGKLVFRRISETAEYVEAQNCIDQSIDSEEPFTVLGIRLQVGEDYIFINDTGEAYDEDMEGIIEYSTPLGSIAVAEYIWNTLGNFSYCSCDFTRRGRGWAETGDLLSIDDNINSKRVNILAQSIELTFSADTGFLEHIVSEAETSAESGNRTTSSSSTAVASANMAVYFSVGSGNANIGSLLSQVVSVQFSAAVTCVPLFAVTIPFTVTTAGTVKFVVIYDGTTINSYSEYCPAGVHFKTVTMPLLGTGNGGHSVAVWVSSADAKGTVDGKSTYATVNGSGLESNAAWDGTISAAEMILPISLQNNGISLSDINVVLKANTQTPLKSGFDEGVNAMALTAGGIELTGMNDSVAVLTEDIPHVVTPETIQNIALAGPQITLGTIADSVIISTEDEIND